MRAFFGERASPLAVADAVASMEKFLLTFVATRGVQRAQNSLKFLCCRTLELEHPCLIIMTRTILAVGRVNCLVLD